MTSGTEENQVETLAETLNKTKLNTNSNVSSKKKSKKSPKPEWNRYIWHLNDKERAKLMTLPEIPKSVKKENKEILKRRSRSAKIAASSVPDSKTKSPKTRTLSGSTSRSLSRTKSARNSQCTEEEADETEKSARSSNDAKETNTYSISEKAKPNSDSHAVYKENRKIKFYNIKDLEAKHQNLDASVDQVKVSTSYKNLIRSMRANL